MGPKKQPQHRMATVVDGVVTRTEVKNHDEGTTADVLATRYVDWTGGQDAAVWMDPKVRVRVGDHLDGVTPPSCYSGRV